MSKMLILQGDLLCPLSAPSETGRPQEVPQGAYSAESIHRIRLIASTQSTGWRPPIPLHCVHLIRPDPCNRSATTRVPHYGSVWLAWVKPDSLRLMDSPEREIR